MAIDDPDRVVGEIVEKIRGHSLYPRDGTAALPLSVAKEQYDEGRFEPVDDEERAKMGLPSINTQQSETTPKSDDEARDELFDMALQQRLEELDWVGAHSIRDLRGEVVDALAKDPMVPYDGEGDRPISHRASRDDTVEFLLEHADKTRSILNTWDTDDEGG